MIFGKFDRPLNLSWRWISCGASRNPTQVAAILITNGKSLTLVLHLCMRLSQQRLMRCESVEGLQPRHPSPTDDHIACVILSSAFWMSPWGGSPIYLFFTSFWMEEHSAHSFSCSHIQDLSLIWDIRQKFTVVCHSFFFFLVVVGCLSGMGVAADESIWST